jgi:hypothetical protein
MVEATQKHSHEWHELEQTAALFRTLPTYAVPETTVESIKELLQSGRFTLFTSSDE